MPERICRLIFQALMISQYLSSDRVVNMGHLIYVRRLDNISQLRYDKIVDSVLVTTTRTIK